MIQSRLYNSVNGIKLSLAAMTRSWRKWTLLADIVVMIYRMSQTCLVYSMTLCE